MALTKLPSEPVELTPRNPAVEESVKKGLRYLASVQSRDGSWGGRSSSYSQHVGITGLCGMALMCSGNLPGRAEYGKNVEGALSFVLSMMGRDGFIGTASSGMYGHGFATLFLAEVYGMTRREDLDSKLRLATDLIVRTQRPDGGWRYEPINYGYSDVSVTTCIIMALRAVRNAGVDVPQRTIDRALKYLRECVNPDGGVRYMLHRGESRPALTAATIVSFYGLGRFDLPEIQRAVKFLDLYHRRYPLRNHQPSHYYYTLYYEAQAMYQVGGDYWKKWYTEVSSILLRKQRGDGSWQDSVGNAYATAMACLVLQVPYGYLPIFQR